MLLRDYFAAKAMNMVQDLFDFREVIEHETLRSDMASSCYAIADAMLAAREEKP
jgi:hypothetical protein